MILDIETTGLSPQYHQVILVGIIYAKNNKWYITQIFCDHRTEERELLLELKEYIKDQLIITYNGYAFDIPFLNKRYAHHKIYYKLNAYSNFDLYRVVRASKKALNLPNYKLKTIEEYLGIYREDQISGRESVLLYDAYEETRDKELRRVILLHNADDIEYMIPTLRILDHVPLRITEKYYPFHFKSEKFKTLIVNKFDQKKDYLEVVFYAATKEEALVDVSNDFSLSITEDLLTVKVPLFRIGDRSFIDVDEISYLNLYFNDMSLDEQLKYEITDMKNTLNQLVRIIDQHTF